MRISDWSSDVCSSDLLDERGLAAARDALDGPTIITLTGDVSDEKLWAQAAPFLEGLDFALANAGVAGNGDIPNHDFAEWRRIMAVNLDGVFLTLRAAINAMQAHQRGGSIVITSSASGLKDEPDR